MEVSSLVVQVWDDTGLDQGGKVRGIEKWSHSGCMPYFVWYVNYVSICYIMTSK